MHFSFFACVARVGLLWRLSSWDMIVVLGNVAASLVQVDCGLLSVFLRRFYFLPAICVVKKSLILPFPIFCCKSLTLCLFQVGCKMGCTFCATGTMGYKSNLTSGEIVEQLVHASRFSQIRNVVFMVIPSTLSFFRIFIVESNFHFTVDHDN